VRLLPSSSLSPFLRAVLMPRLFLAATTTPVRPPSSRSSPSALVLSSLTRSPPPLPPSFATGSWDSVAGHQASVFGATPNSLSTDRAIRFFTDPAKGGVRPDKLVLGASAALVGLVCQCRCSERAHGELRGEDQLLTHALLLVAQASRSTAARSPTRTARARPSKASAPARGKQVRPSHSPSL